MKFYYAKLKKNDDCSRVKTVVVIADDENDARNKLCKIAKDCYPDYTQITDVELSGENKGNSKPSDERRYGMKSWCEEHEYCYIHGTIVVLPLGRTQHEKGYVLNTVLDHLPLVGFSDEFMNVYVIQKKGNDWASPENEFGERANNVVGGSFEMQAEYIVLVDGKFKHTELDDVLKSFEKWLIRFAKRMPIDDVSVKVGKSHGKEVIFDNRNGKWGDIYEPPLFYSSNSDSWCEYLLWDYPVDSEADCIRGKPSVHSRFRFSIE